MTSEIPPWLGYVVGGTLFCLVGIILFSILIYALRESKRVAEQEARQRDERLRAVQESGAGMDVDSQEDRENNSRRSFQDETENEATRS